MAGPKSDVYRSLFATAHEWLNGTFAGLTDEQVTWLPSGNVVPAGAHYAHHVSGEDFFVNALFAGNAPLMASTYAGKTGLSELPPQGDWSGWAKSVQINQSALMEYSAAVFAATDAYLAGLADTDFERSIDLTAMGMGSMSLGELVNIILLDTGMHCGEISAVKGLQGLKGYPF